MNEKSDTLFACPECKGWHFNISKRGLLVCTSGIKRPGEWGCGWKGHLPAKPAKPAVDTPAKQEPQKWPFDLQLALAGHPLVTRDGRMATDFKLHAETPITYEFSANKESVYCVWENGRGHSNEAVELPWDLFLAEPPQKWQKERDAFAQGKREALEVANQLQEQEIGREIGLTLGQRISPAILPWIKEAKVKLAALQSAAEGMERAIMSLPEKLYDGPHECGAKIMVMWDGCCSRSRDVAALELCILEHIKESLTRYRALKEKGGDAT